MKEITIDKDHLETIYALLSYANINKDSKATIKIEDNLLIVKFAKNLNNPTSSRKMDKQVIEKNKIIIFIGLIVVLLVNSDQTSFIGANPVAKRIIAPVKAINQ